MSNKTKFTGLDKVDDSLTRDRIDETDILLWDALRIFRTTLSDDRPSVTVWNLRVISGQLEGAQENIKNIINFIKEE